jgi:hypothetical protein
MDRQLKERATMKHALAIALFVHVAYGCSGADGTITGPAPENAPADVSDTGSAPFTPSGDPTTTPDSAAEDTPSPPPPPKEPELVPVSDLAIRELALFQGVKVPLAKDGESLDVKSKIHVVAGREGILRVYVAPGASWTPREVIAELTLKVDGREPTVLKAQKTVSAPSDEAILDSTINIDIPAGAIEMGASYRVRLLTKPGAPAGTATNNAFPTSDTFAALDTWDTGDTFKVVLVPVKSNGRLPDTSPEQLDRYRKILHAMYPVKKIDLTVREVYEYTGTLGAGGNGIYGLLDAVTALRKSDGAPKDVYYYGAFAPTSSYSTYCSGGCTTGLCHLPGQSDTYLRACVGVGFTGSSSAGTMAHELGHANGIRHAPCGSVAGADGSYPYSGGKIGAWGYDNRSKTLMSPTKFSDFMSYCSPEWISDYAFDKLIHRMSYVAKESLIVGGERTHYQFVHVLPGGKLEWGSDITLDEPMFGEPHEVAYTTETGARAKVTGFFYPNADEGGVVLVPKATLAMRDVEIAGFGLARKLPALP